MLALVAACNGGAMLTDSGALSDGAMGDAAPADAGTDAGPPPMATTACGALVGKVGPMGVDEFLGIPFAAPPVGPLRFKPPAAPTCWTTPRDATAFGPTCLQMVGAVTTPPGPESEDCLSLNVFTPSLTPARPLPVMVWLYGGGFEGGGAASPLYDGWRLASKGAVVVTLNYRLGALGWLGHPALAAEDPHHSSGNYGLLDQIAALEWVRDNISRFGGDPDTVTLFGESAGSFSTCALTTSPLADGLFHRAIMESGSCVAPPIVDTLAARSVADAEAVGTALATAVGCTTGDIAACLRAKSAADLIAMQPPLDLATGTAAFSYVVDGWAIPVAPRDRYADPTFTPVPILVGTNHDEGKIFTFGVTVDTPADYDAAVRRAAGPYADDILAIYPASAFATPHEALEVLLRDMIFLCPTRQLVRAASARQPHVYLYQFTEQNGLEVAGGLGVIHGGEVPFVFGTFAAPFLRPTPEERMVSDATQGYWVRFATTGDPNGAGAVAWPAYTTATDVDLQLGTPMVTEMGLEGALCDMVDAIPPR